MGYGRFYDNWNSIIQLAQNYEGTWPDVGQLIAQNLNHPGGVKATIARSFQPGFGRRRLSCCHAVPQCRFRQLVCRSKQLQNALFGPMERRHRAGTRKQYRSLSRLCRLSRFAAQPGRLRATRHPTPGPVATEAARRPYPYITPTFYDQSVGQSKYNSFQFRLQQRATHGLTYIISYTRSKSMDTGCSGSFGAEGCEIQQPYNYNADRSVSGFDLPNIFSGSFVYDIPVGKGKTFSTHNRFVDYVIGNWQVGGILSLHSGQPFDVTVSNGDTAGTGNTVERANLAKL